VNSNQQRATQYVSLIRDCLKVISGNRETVPDGCPLSWVPGKSAFFCPSSESESEGKRGMEREGKACCPTPVSRA
jgi:hypothetical protein